MIKKIDKIQFAAKQISKRTIASCARVREGIPALSRATIVTDVTHVDARHK